MSSESDEYHITGVSWGESHWLAQISKAVYFLSQDPYIFLDPLFYTVCSLKPCFSLSFFKAFTINLLSLLASQTVDLFINSMYIFYISNTQMAYYIWQNV